MLRKLEILFLSFFFQIQFSSTFTHLEYETEIIFRLSFINFNCFKYKTINGPAQPSAATTATHNANDGATSFATFSQQLNQRHHTTPTAITPVKVLKNVFFLWRLAHNSNLYRIAIRKYRKLSSTKYDVRRSVRPFVKWLDKEKENLHPQFAIIII